MTRTDSVKARILIIDREQSSTDELTTILSDNGYEVVSVMTGQEGLEQAERSSTLSQTTCCCRAYQGLTCSLRSKREAPTRRCI
jgi:PleD family two-component response regulator